jgi:hypothetical protein
MVSSTSFLGTSGPSYTGVPVVVAQSLAKRSFLTSGTILWSTLALILVQGFFVGFV